MPNHKGHTPLPHIVQWPELTHNPPLIITRHWEGNLLMVCLPHIASAGAHTILVEMSQNSAPGTKSNPRVYIRTCTCDSGFRVYLRSPDPYCSSICLLQDCLGYFRAFNVTRVGRPGLQRPRAVPFIREGR